VTDERQPLDTALDLLFYAPLGLALTAVEEVPKLAEKGRRRFTSQWNTAKVVGRFAVTQGRKQASDRFARPTEPREAPTPAPWTPAEAPPTAEVRPDPGPDVVAAAAGDGAARAAPAGTRDGARPADAGPVPGVDELAIPDYDSLSASQVVQRLAGLAPGELDAVRRYEGGTRGRRTILTRVAQLQGT
jgi:hypothetical protein